PPDIAHFGAGYRWRARRVLKSSPHIGLGADGVVADLAGQLGANLTQRPPSRSIFVEHTPSHQKRRLRTSYTRCGMSALGQKLTFQRQLAWSALCHNRT